MIYDRFKPETEIKDSSRRLLPSTNQNKETTDTLEPYAKIRQCPKTDRVLTDDLSVIRRSPFLLRSVDLIPIRSHSCPECRKNFATSSGLKQHQHIHKSVKPFQCKVCLKAYTQFSNLCRHKRMHADCRQQIKCLACGQAFSTLISLNKHKRFCDADDRGRAAGGIIRQVHQTSDQFCHPPPRPPPPPPMPVYRSHLGVVTAEGDPVTLPYPPPLGLSQPWNIYRPQLPHQISSHPWFPGTSSSPSSSSAPAPATVASVPTTYEHHPFGLIHYNAYETFQRLMDARLSSPTYNRPLNLNENHANRTGYDVRSPEVNGGRLSPENVCREPHQETRDITAKKRDSVNSVRYRSPDPSVSNTSTSPSPGSSTSGFRVWRETSPAPRSRDREPIVELETKESSFLSCQTTIAKSISSREESRPLDLTTSHKSFEQVHLPVERKRTDSIVKTSFPSVESLASSSSTAEMQVLTKPVLDLGLPISAGGLQLQDLHGPSTSDMCLERLLIPSPSDRDICLGRSRFDGYGAISPLANTPRAPTTTLFDEQRFLGPLYPQLLADQQYLFDHDRLPFINQRSETGHPSITNHHDPYYGNHHHSISSFSPGLISPLASISDLLSFKPASVAHKPRDRYTCRYCGKVFPRSANLTRHLRTHTGEQPYKCQYCRRCFSISSNLQRHVRNIHNKEKPFRCPLCERCFGQQTNLDRHVKKHESTETSSPCSPTSPDCPSGFLHRRHLDPALLLHPRRDQFFQDHHIGFLRNPPSLPQPPLATPRDTDSWQVPGNKVDSGVESTDGNSSPARWREVDDWEMDHRKCEDGGRRRSVDSESGSIDVVDTDSNVDNDVIDGNDDISTCIYGSDQNDDDDDDVIIDVTECPVTP